MGGCFQRYYFSGLLLTLRASKIDLSLSRESTAPVPKDTAEVLFYHRATWALRRIFPNQIPVWQPVTRIGTASTQPGSWEWRKGLWTIETTRRCWLVPGWILRVCDQGGTEHKTGQRRVQELWMKLLKLLKLMKLLSWDVRFHTLSKSYTSMKYPLSCFQFNQTSTQNVIFFTYYFCYLCKYLCVYL